MPRKIYRRRKAQRRKNQNPNAMTSREFKSMKSNMFKLSIPKYLTPFPREYKIKLVYTGWIHDGKAGDGTNVHTSYSFKLNSCYDPYGGVTGDYNVQPYFWDQISAIYKKYLVTSAKAEVQYNRPQVTDVMSVMRASTVSTLPSDFQLEESRPGAVKSQHTVYGTGKKISRYYSVASVHGVPGTRVVSDDLYSAAVGADPSLIAYLQIMNVNAPNNTTNNPMAFNVKITQYCTMFDRTVVSGS